MKTTFQVIRDTESGEYEDYNRDRDVIFEAATEAIAMTIARMECEDDRNTCAECGNPTPMEEIKVGNDCGFGWDDGDLHVCYLVHRADIYETEQEYLHELAMRKRAEREHGIALDALGDWEEYTSLHTFPIGWLEYDVNEIGDHITVDFWDKRTPYGTLYQVQYDNDTLCAVRKWDRRLENGNADPDSCTIYLM